MLAVSVVRTANLRMLQKLSSPFREFGFFAGFVYAIHRLLQRISPSMKLMFHDWMVQPIASEQLLPARFAQRYRTREIGQEDPLIDGMPIRPEVRISRREQRAICLGTFKNEALVGYIWLSSGSYDEDEARCRYVLTPPNESIFDFDLYILPKYRASLGFAAVWNGTNEYLYRRGVRYSYSRLDHYNRASASAHDHLGWKRVGSAVILKLWQIEVMFSSLFPWFFLTFSDEQRPSITLSPDILND